MDFNDRNFQERRFRYEDISSCRTSQRSLLLLIGGIVLVLAVGFVAYSFGKNTASDKPSQTKKNINENVQRVEYEGEPAVIEKDSCVISVSEDTEFVPVPADYICFTPFQIDADGRVYDGNSFKEDGNGGLLLDDNQHQIYKDTGKSVQYFGEVPASYEVKVHVVYEDTEKTLTSDLVIGDNTNGTLTAKGESIIVLPTDQMQFASDLPAEELPPGVGGDIIGMRMLMKLGTIDGKDRYLTIANCTYSDIRDANGYGKDGMLDTFACLFHEGVVLKRTT